MQTGHNFCVSQNHFHWPTKSNHMQGWDMVTTRYNPLAKWFFWKESFPKCLWEQSHWDYSGTLTISGKLLSSAHIVINISASTWMFLNKTELQISQQQTGQPFICINVQNTFLLFVPLCCTMLRLIMLISKCSNETALKINAYGHWLHLFCIFLGAIFLGQKSDLLPCSSEMGHYVYMYFQNSVKLTFFEPVIVGKKWRKLEHLPLGR